MAKDCSSNYNYHSLKGIKDGKGLELVLGESFAAEICSENGLLDVTGRLVRKSCPSLDYVKFINTLWIKFLGSQSETAVLIVDINILRLADRRNQLCQR